LYYEFKKVDNRFKDEELGLIEKKFNAIKGKTFNDVTNETVGMKLKQPYGIEYSELAINFYVTVNNGRVYELDFFYDWIVDDGFNNSTGSVFKNQNGVYVSKYREDYAKDVFVDILNHGNEEVIRGFQFINAYPTSVNFSDLGYDNNDSLLDVTVNFAFDDLVEYK